MRNVQKVRMVGGHYPTLQDRLRLETREDKGQQVVFEGNKHRKDPNHAVRMAYKTALIPAGK